MKRIKTICFILAALLCFGSVSCLAPAKERAAVSPNSYFDRFIISEGRVYMLCYLELVNGGAERELISIRGYSAEDAENGLLKQKELEFYLLDVESLASVTEENVAELIKPAGEITIGANDTAALWACFVGEHGGGAQKHDRDLPEIELALLPKDRG